VESELTMKILVVDDSDPVRFDLRLALQEEGFEVVEAENGMDALHIADRNTDLDLVVTDLNMPVMDGLSFCERFVALPGRNEIPIVVLSTEVSKQLKAQGKEVGVRLWIVKPFEKTSFLAAVHRLLGA
jgi:two-component system, chemotaxis family, chemotaxis protein CheY